jgi:hypothetical protein
MIGGHTFCASRNHISLKVERLEAKVTVVGSTNEDWTLELIFNLIGESIIHFWDTFFMEKVWTVLN